MKVRIFALALVFIICSLKAISQTQLEPPGSSSIFVKAGRLLDARKGSYIENAGIWIEGERIKEVGAVAYVQSHVPKNAAVIDLGACDRLAGSH